MLFSFISQRYQRGSLIVTSNLGFAEWTEVFGDPRLTSALLDRLTHRCHILEFKGKSHRFRQSLQRQAGSSDSHVVGGPTVEPLAEDNSEETEDNGKNNDKNNSKEVSNLSVE